MQAKSRSQSPALFWQRNKVVDPSSPRDSITVSPKSATISPDVQEGVEQYRDMNMPAMKSENERSQSSMPPPVTTAFSKLKGPDSPSLGRSHSRSRTRSLTQSMISRMQPTVADVSDDEAAKEAGRTRSSATSLVLNSADSSEIVSQPLTKPPTAPAVPQSSEMVGEPLKPSNSTPSMAALKRSSPTPRPAELCGQSVASQHYSDPTPPGSFPSPQPESIEFDSPISPRSTAYESTQQRPVDASRQRTHSATVTPTISPPRSPRLNHQPPLYSPPPVPYMYGYPPQVGAQQPGPVPYYQHVQQPYVPSPPLSHPDVVRSSLADHKDEHQRDWHKVTSVLPELNRILSHFEGQKGPSSSKESFAKQLDYQRTQEMAKLRVELEANKEEYEKVIQKLVSESYKYKSEIRDRDDRMVKMQATIADLSAQQSDCTALKTKQGGSTAQNETLRKDYAALLSRQEQTTSELHALKQNHETLQKRAETSLSDVQHYKKESATWKDRYQEASAASDQARLAKEDLVSVKMRLEETVDELRRKLHGKDDKHQAELRAVRKEHENVLEAKEREKSTSSNECKATVASLQLEIAGLTDRHGRAKKDLEAARAHNSILEKKLDANKRDTEAQVTSHRQEMETKGREMDTQSAAFKQLLASKDKEFEEQESLHRNKIEYQLVSLTAQRHRELDLLRDEQAQALRKLFQDHEAESRRIDEQHADQVRSIQCELAEQKGEFDRYRQETEGLRVGHGKLAATMVSWRAEQEKMNRVLETLGLDVKASGT
jgi:hypothetical protein